jgi:hypothetical protein
VTIKDKNSRSVPSTKTTPKSGWITPGSLIGPVIDVWQKLLLIDFQGQNMTPEREMIVWAVLQGKLPEQMLTQEEVDEVLVLVQEAIMDKRLQEAESAGNPSVFWGFDEDTLH